MRTGEIIENFVRWEGDGSYTPFCEVCEWEGLNRLYHSEARSAARSRLRSKRHQDRSAS